jgi:hypothetical protein
MTSGAPLHRIELHLARTREHPEGSSRHQYVFIAPLDADSRIDLAGWKLKRQECTVKRSWGDEPTERGWLVHRPGGATGATWGFEYDPTTDDDNESGYRFGEHAFTPGEYVSIRDHDGELQTFRVVSVRPA